MFINDPKDLRKRLVEANCRELEGGILEQRFENGEACQYRLEPGKRTAMCREIKADGRTGEWQPCGYVSHLAAHNSPVWDWLVRNNIDPRTCIPS